VTVLPSIENRTRKTPGRRPEHLPEGDAEKLGFFLCDRMPIGHGTELGDGLFQSRIPAASGGRGPLGKVMELVDGIGPGPR
jgi:hypothetical protein